MIDRIKQLLSHFNIFDRFLQVQIQRVIVNHVLVFFEKLDRNLVQLEHQNFVQKPITLNVLVGPIDRHVQLGNLLLLVFLGHEERG